MAQLSARIDPARFSGHSFHTEAAIAAAANGVSDSTIQSLGRRASGAFLLYILIAQHELDQLLATQSKD